jgi:glutamyl-tRNA synthetase
VPIDDEGWHADIPSKRLATAGTPSFTFSRVGIDRMSVVTRFAPSPTGFLHIGGARTALFNWLFTRHHGGKFLLRIEDTDRKRSSDEAVQAILNDLTWMELDWDGEAVFQFQQQARHAEVAKQMVEAGHAYYCFSTPEELAAMREKARAEKKPMRYDGTWRDRDPSDGPEGVAPVIRLKAQQTGKTTITDLVQGTIIVNNAELDDMVLLRGDGTPTYMLSVVVDDHDMGITHVIRGDDHLNNAFRQAQVFKAMDWDLPEFAHIPLIHGPDGAKMSKRHGALGVDAYRDMGFLPEAMRNYLFRLGWSYGEEETISTERAAELFDLHSVGRSAARFDMARLTNMNGQYIRSADDSRLVALIEPLLESEHGQVVDKKVHQRLLDGMEGLKSRAKSVLELAESAVFYARDGVQPLNEKATKLLDEAAKARLAKLSAKLVALPVWDDAAIEAAVRAVAEAEAVKLVLVAQPLRAAIAGSNMSPSMFEVMRILGREESLTRLNGHT